MTSSKPDRPNPTIIREFPKSTNDFLRFQVGRMETRFARYPVYGRFESSMTEYGRPIYSQVMNGHEDDPKDRVEVFRLLGWGSTLAKAEIRAAKSEKPQTARRT